MGYVTSAALDVRWKEVTGSLVQHRRAGSRLAGGGPGAPLPLGASLAGRAIYASAPPLPTSPSPPDTSPSWACSCRALQGAGLVGLTGVNM